MSKRTAPTVFPMIALTENMTMEETSSMSMPIKPIVVANCPASLLSGLIQLSMTTFVKEVKKVTSIYNDIFSDKTNGKCGYLPNTCRSKPNPLNRVQDSRHLIHHKDISQLDSNDQRIREFHHESKLYDKVYHISKWNCGESAQTQMSFFYHQICPFLASLMIIK